METPEVLSARLDRYYAAPQTLVKVAARRRLNLLIVGEGEPTVIFAPGSGASTLEWMLVQHPIAAKTRTVAFDNAGFGFSDPGPTPRTASAMVNDLRAALRAANIPPPYVLAGWSWGGLVMRLFAFNNPREVVGLVMVDSSNEHQLGRLLEDPKAIAWQRGYRRRLMRAEQLARAGALVEGTPEFDDFVGGPYSSVTPAVNAALRAQLTSPGRYRALRSESASWPASLREMDMARAPLGDLPLKVLSAADEVPMPFESVDQPETWREYWRIGQDQIAALSTRGEQRTIDAGHAIQIEKPEVVIAATEEVLALAQRDRS
jgi:pimeloyl-ACP methyl ester carboxylesterase